MNELVQRLSAKDHNIQANRDELSAKALQERIKLNFVHIFFEETGTEIGMRLDQEKCDLSKANFENKKGKVHLEGALSLNYDKVRCIVDISLSTMKGKGKLKLIEDESTYNRIVGINEVV